MGTDVSRTTRRNFANLEHVLQRVRQNKGFTLCCRRSNEKILRQSDTVVLMEYELRREFRWCLAFILILPVCAFHGCVSVDTRLLVRRT